MTQRQTFCKMVAKNLPKTSRFRLSPRGWEPHFVSTEWCPQGALLTIWQRPMFTDEFLCYKMSVRADPYLQNGTPILIDSHLLASACSSFWPVQNGRDCNEFSQDPWATNRNSPADPTTFPSRLSFFPFLSLLLCRAQAFRGFFE